MGFNNEHTSSLCKGAGCRHLRGESYGGRFPHALSTFTLSPLRKALPFPLESHPGGMRDFAILPWVWDFGVLDMAISMSTTHIH